MTTLFWDRRFGLIAGVFALLLCPGLSPGAAVGHPAPSTRVAALLNQAERALAEDRLTVPSGRNAVAYAQEVLDLDPGNSEAERILRAVVVRYDLIAGAALDRAEVLRRQELARAETYRSRGEGVVGRFDLSVAPLSEVAERLDGVAGRPTEATAGALQRHPLARRMLSRLVGEYLHKSEAALDGTQVGDARRYCDLAAQIARDHGVPSPGLDGIDRRVAAAERERDQALAEAREDAESASAKGGLLKAVFLPPSF